MTLDSKQIIRAAYPKTRTAAEFLDDLFPHSMAQYPLWWWMWKALTRAPVGLFDKVIFGWMGWRANTAKVRLQEQRRRDLLG